MSSVVDSTCIPSVVEIREAQLALQRDGQELEHVESVINGLYAEIEAIHKRVSLLQEKRHAVQSRIFTNRARISPIRFLPTEILQRIFKACLPDDRYVKPEIQSAPLLLCQICRRWREVAEASSELWSSIAVEDFINNQSKSYMAMVTRWLVTSHHRPLTVSLLCHYSTPLTPVLRLLVSHSALIRDLRIQGNNLNIVKLISACVSPVLKHLLLDVWSSGTNSPLPGTYPPNLTHLGIRESRPHFLASPAASPKITHLSLDIPVVDFIKILVDFPALVRLTTSLSKSSLWATNPSSDAVPIEHRALEILRIYLKCETTMLASNAESLARTFDLLSLPSLRVLTFLNHRGRGVDHSASLDLWLAESAHALFDRSSCLLKRLRFHDFERPLDMDVLCEQFRSFGIDLRVDNDDSESFW
ncbi:hypothetical protein AZE42_01819 [Rhizopogon vesiculosus]|uniref:F-box domain-containing protein n=1 Tax=Rhizopogon vesiculosus TaxID=180088 RepID=A0A1J8Q997_9AGAM|nr:hypothetical protein AZE42_01819 [Rhizopogon vesiculosus]